MKNKRKIFLILALLPVLCIAILLIGSYMMFYNDPPDIQREKAFIQNLSMRKEIASTYLSAHLKSVVAQDCLGASLIACTSNLIPFSWGTIKDIKWGAGDPGSYFDSTIYYTWWSDISEPIVIVVITDEENGITVINGWRGFVPSEGEDKDAELLYGSRHENEFPKVTAQPSSAIAPFRLSLKSMTKYTHG